MQSWKQRDGWDDIAPISRVESGQRGGLIQLIAKPQKDERRFPAKLTLRTAGERLARVNAVTASTSEADLNPNVANRNKERKSRKRIFQRRGYRKLEIILRRPSSVPVAVCTARRAGAPLTA